VKTELLDRAMPQDLHEACERVAHFIAHYNHFRPHQGIDGMVPADRFFGAEEAVRKTLEAQLHENELALALGETPRRAVLLYGRVGEQEVSPHGERRRLRPPLRVQLPEVRHRLLAHARTGPHRAHEPPVGVGLAVLPDPRVPQIHPPPLSAHPGGPATG
jgi:hypothetical protein